MRKSRRISRSEPRDYVSVEPSVVKVTVAFELASVDYEAIAGDGLRALEAEICALSGVERVEGDQMFGPVIFADLQLCEPLVGANEARLELPIVGKIKDLIRAGVRRVREARP